MSSETSRKSGMKYFVLLVVFILAVVVTFSVFLLLENVRQRKEEARQYYFPVVQLDENTLDPEVWGKNFSFQYDSYRRTVDIERTKHGGSEAFGKLEADPRWVTLFMGYGFGVDYREERGHAYMLSDQDETRRISEFKQPGACLHCHASVIPAYRQAGKEAGIPDDQPSQQIMAGFEAVCAMPYAEARKLVSHPITCLDCHDPATMQLRVTRPGFINGILALANSEYPLPQFASIERWRKEKKGEYDANTMASRQEMRSFVCGQCHVEYYFKGEKKTLTYPWHNGLKVEQSEKYYEEVKFQDWTHQLSGAPLLKAQHPEFELWNQGIHARSGVACADCHMPYMRVGAVKVSDHHVRSPLLNVNRACQTCHHFEEAELKARAEAIQDKTAALLSQAEEAVLDLIGAIEAAQKAGASEEQLAAARDFHRKAFWRLDYISAENSTGFHAAQESARILAESIDLARRGQVNILETVREKP